VAMFRQVFKTYGLLILGVVLLTAPLVSAQYQFYVLERGVQNAIHVMGLLILIGYSGMLSLGSAGLLATGAYAYALLLLKVGMSPWVAAILAIAITTLVGLILAFPAFRLSGPFLAVTTVGFGEIIRILILNLEPLTGGAYGVAGFKKLLPNDLLVYYAMVAALVLVAVATSRLGRSRIGLALKAVRQDEVAAEVMGVHVKRVKMVAFALSAMLAGMSGVFLANLAGYLSPDSFTSAESSSYLLMVVMGGMNSSIGVIISSIIVTWLPEVLRFLSSSRLLVYSLVLLVYLRINYVPSTRASVLSLFKKFGVGPVSTEVPGTSGKGRGGV
jgi:branched-chain amino acid transport system permease protein